MVWQSFLRILISTILILSYSDLYAFWPFFSSKSPQNLIIISTDSLRADFMSLYGYKYPTSKNIDKIAKKAYVFEKAYSPGSRTTVSLPSLHKGLYPDRIKFSFYPQIKNRIIPDPNFHKKIKNGKYPVYTSVVDNDLNPTLAGILSRYGYETACYIDPQNMDYFKKEYGFINGFKEQFNGDFKIKFAGADRIREEAQNFILKQKQNEKPFYVWLHFMDTHFPYYKHTKGRNFSGGVKGRYEAVITYFDQQISKFYDFIEKNKLLKNTILVITSDHGEEFRDHGGMYHGSQIYEESIHVPLIIKIPDHPGKRVPNPVSIVDILPSVLPYLYYNGQSEDFDYDESGFPNLDGIDIIRLAQTSKGSDEFKQMSPRPIFLENFNSWMNRPAKTSQLLGVIQNEWKYILNAKSGKEMVFNLKDDPREKNNLIYHLSRNKLKPEEKKKLKSKIEKLRKLLKKYQNRKGYPFIEKYQID
jgi:arylsulfatase A-like enzyme